MTQDECCVYRRSSSASLSSSSLSSSTITASGIVLAVSTHLLHHYRRYHHYCLVLVVVFDSAVSTGTTTPRVACVRIKHCTFTLGPGDTHVPSVSLSLVVIASLVLHSWLLPEMQNQIEIKRRREKAKKRLAGPIERKNATKNKPATRS